MRPPQIANARRSWVTDSYRRYATKYGRVSVTKLGAYWFIDDWLGAEAGMGRPWMFAHFEDAMASVHLVLEQRRRRG